MGNKSNNSNTLCNSRYRRILDMNKYTYKLQGNGRDSWVCEEPDGNSYMVFEDPTKVETLEEKAIRLSNELQEIINLLKK